MIHNLYDTAKAVLRGRFIMIQTHLRKEEKISNEQHNLTPEGTEKEQTKSKVNRRKEVIKIRAEINDTEIKIQ